MESIRLILSYTQAWITSFSVYCDLTGLGPELPSPPFAWGFYNVTLMLKLNQGLEIVVETEIIYILRTSLPTPRSKSAQHNGSHHPKSPPFASDGPELY